MSTTYDDGSTTYDSLSVVYDANNPAPYNGPGIIVLDSINCQLQQNPPISTSPIVTYESTITFKVSITKDGGPWNLTDGVVNVLLTDPNGNLITIPGYMLGSGVAFGNWTVPNIQGNWIRAWDITDANGVRFVSLPIHFTVIDSPR